MTWKRFLGNDLNGEVRSFFYYNIQDRRKNAKNISLSTELKMSPIDWRMLEEDIIAVAKWLLIWDPYYLQDTNLLSGQCLMTLQYFEGSLDHFKKFHFIFYFIFILSMVRAMSLTVGVRFARESWISGGKWRHEKGKEILQLIFTW